MKHIFSSPFFLLLSVLIASLASCVKDDDYKIPEVQCPEDVTVTKTVQEIHDMATPDVQRYNENDFIEAYVVSNDTEGNFFKNLHVQTLSGTIGFAIPIDQTDLHTLYSPGRKVIVKLLDNYIKIDNEALEIGSLFIDRFQNEQIGRIPYPSFEKIVLKTCEVVSESSLIKMVSINELSDKHLHTLIELTDVQFVEDALGKNLYDRDLDEFGATFHQIQDKSRAIINLKTSSFANFANKKVPVSNGTITGVLTKFKGDYQIIPRIESDFNLINTRSRFDFVDEVNGASIKIEALRNLYPGSETLLLEDQYIEGVVTLSGFDSDNIDDVRAFIQDSTAAIALSFSDPTTISKGTQIKINLKDVLLNKENGLLQVNLKQQLDVQFVSDGVPPPEPVALTISQFLTGHFESQLVILNSVQFESEQGIYNGTQIITDCISTTGVLTHKNAPFSNQNYPSENGDIIGIASRNSDPILVLRDLNDVDGLNEDRCIMNVEPITSIFFSELADPNNNSGARFIEIYNSSDQIINLNGWMIRRYTNDNQSTSSSVDLSGINIQGGQAFVIASKAIEFEATFGFAPDFEAGTGGPADSNGDDNLELVDSKGIVIDTFGIPGEDGSGTNHEFEDGRAIRNSIITMANPIYLFSEWQLWNDTGAAGTVNLPQDAPGNFTPGQR